MIHLLFVLFLLPKKKKTCPEREETNEFCLEILLQKLKQEQGTICRITYWVIQNDCGQVWQLCTKIYLATM
jgi:hypothetical protein